MGVDLCVNYACEPKRALGGPELESATKRVRELLQTAARADLLEADAKAKGTPPEEASVEMTRMGDDGTTTTVTFRYPTLRAESAALEPLEHHCKGCKANVSGEPYGCFRLVQYPIARAAEEWLLAQVEPADKLGGIVLVAAMTDFEWGGEPIQGMRNLNLFEAKEAPTRDLGGNTILSANVLWHPLIALPGSLSPSHCAIVLSIFGAVEVDGKRLAGDHKRAIRPMMDVPPHERATRTKLVLPDPPPDADAGAVVLRYFYNAWCNATTLLSEG